MRHKLNNVYVICIIASLFPFLGFWQLSIINILSNHISDSMQIPVSKVINLAAIYTYADALALIPIGILLDKYSTKKVLCSGLIIFNLGLLIFSLSDNYTSLLIGRFITGVGHAIGLLGCFSLVKDIIKRDKQTLWISITLTIAFAGGLMAQAPTAVLLNIINWREFTLFTSFLGVLLFFILVYIIPRATKVKTDNISDNIKNIFLSFKNIRNWYCAVFVFLQDATIMVIGAMLGYSYLVHQEKFTPTIAASITSMMYVGTILGSPILGYIADRVQALKTQILLCGLIACLSMLSFYFFSNISLVFYLILFFSCGIFTSIQGIGYSSVHKLNRSNLSNTAMSVVNVIIMLGLGLIQSTFIGLYTSLNLGQMFLALAALTFVGSVFGYFMVKNNE
jgi:predicted MFS family arabinose efflux permease